MIEVQPRIGDGIHTFGQVDLLQKPLESIVTLGIQGAQRFGRWKGMPRIQAPYWKLTHSMAYQGELSEAYIRAAWLMGQLSPTEARRLSDFDDWVFSMTWPVGVWVRWAEIREKSHGLVGRPNFCLFNEPWQLRAWEHALWWFYGRSYDDLQLGGILANLLGESEPKKYKRILDRSRFRTVCSGAVGAGWEAVRRQAILRSMGPDVTAREWITCDDMGEWEKLGGAGWWPRILNSLHLEKHAPGHLCMKPWFEIAGEF